MFSQQRRIISVKYMVECKTGKQRLTNAHKLNAYNHHIHSRVSKQCETNTCPDIHLIILAWSRVRGLISNLSQMVEIMMKGSERLRQLQQPTVWLQQQIVYFKENDLLWVCF